MYSFFCFFAGVTRASPNLCAQRSRALHTCVSATDASNLGAAHSRGAFDEFLFSTEGLAHWRKVFTPA